MAQRDGKILYYPLNIPLSESLRDILEILHRNGKQVLIVGGAVRDAVLGDIPKDIDVEVYGVSYPELQSLLSDYLAQKRISCPNSTRKGHTDFAGRSFGVVKFCDLEGNQYDFAIPRRESKRVGGLHTDFDIIPDPSMTPRDAAERRDFTWNAMGYDPLTHELHDYFGGVLDIQDRLIRHTSKKFSEDPLRVLRGMQFAARLGYDTAPETVQLARQMADQFPERQLVHEHRGLEYSVSGDVMHVPHLARERIADEFMKFATKAVYPARALDYLLETDWIRFFPELELMHKNLPQHYLDQLSLEEKLLYDGDGIPQDPQWHPEGNLWNHTREVMDIAALIADRDHLQGDERAVLIFAAMLHDVGKAAIDEEGMPITRLRDKRGSLRWTAHGHEPASGTLSESFLQRIGIKKSIMDAVVVLVSHHLATGSIGADPSDKAVNNLSMRLHKKNTNIEMLMRLVEADRSGCVSPDNHPEAGQPLGLEDSQAHLLAKARELGVSQAPMSSFIQGRDIQQICPDLKPGPVYGQLINRFYNLQTSGEIKTREEALKRLKDYCERKKRHNNRP